MKKPFILKALNTAVLSTLGLTGLTTEANAVHINPNGLGQALIYPYYTVRSDQGNAYDTYMSVVNSSSSSKAVRVRFREGKNSRSVIDLNVYLGQYDVWTAAVVATPDGARLISADKTCTTPVIPASGMALSNAAYSGSLNDNETDSMDRTREGFVEVIEMGDPGSNIAGAPNCAAMADSMVPSTIRPGKGGLSGTGTLINVLNGVDYSYNAVALDGFTATTLWQPAGNAHPDLSDVNPKISNMLNTGMPGSPLVSSDWQGSSFNPADPVSAVLMRDSIINEFVLDAETLSGTDWVVTMPTKHFYVGVDPVIAGVRANSSAQRPFQRNFGAGGACHNGQPLRVDRESNVYPNFPNVNPPMAPAVFCWAATVVSFTPPPGPVGIPPPIGHVGSILGSTNRFVNFAAYFNGWHRITFSQALPSAGAVVYPGLPVVGFMVQDFVNGTLQAGDGGRVLSNYGGLFEHKYTQSPSAIPLP